ncbi:MAG: peptidoglycan DD-metalloendopeptidase family protein [Alphaproteobacteria bacterium]
MYFCILLVFSCSQKPAKIINRSNVLYDKKNQFNLDKYQNLSKKSLPKKPVLNPEKNLEKNLEKNIATSQEIIKKDQDLASNNSAINPETKSHKTNNQPNNISQTISDNNDLKITIAFDNETLYSLAKKYQISAREIIDLNKLKAPYRLKKGDIIKIPHQQFHIVKKGETLFGIARNYHMKIDEIIAINKLEKPYAVKINSKLQITNYKNLEAEKNLTNKAVEQKNSKPNNLADSFANNSLANSVVKNSQTVKKLQADMVVGNNLNKTATANDSKLTNDNVEVGKSLANNSSATNTNSNDSVEQTSETSSNNSSPQLTKNNESSSPSTTLTQNKIISKQEEASIDDKKNIFSWPVRGSVVSKFGPKKGGLYNDGINIKAKEGASVGSAEDGIVAYAGNELKGYGNLVIIKHSAGWITAYAHLKEINVSKGQKILKAQKIGSVGNTGSVNFAQLYFGLRKGREAVNPQHYLKGLN